MKYKIGVFGSAVVGELDSITIKKAEELGTTLAKYKLTCITGACSGLPYLAAYNARNNGADVLGFSPEVDLKNQKKFTPTDDLTIYKNLIFIPKNFPLISDQQTRKKYRNVISTSNCDAGIIISGRWGTLNEFTNLYDMGKVIGILTGTGGIADEIENLNKKIFKKSKAKIIFNNSPTELVKKVIAELELRN